MVAPLKTQTSSPLSVRMTRGAASAYLAATRPSNMSGGSTTWSSTLMKIISSTCMQPARYLWQDPRMPGTLDGVRVLDLSWGIAGALGVLLLAEQGADVVKVEPPGGDPFRDYSGYAVWNRSRRSVTLDLKHPEGQAAFHKLAAGADVLVETFRPGVTDRLGIGYDALHAENPRLVYCSCP